MKAKLFLVIILALAVAIGGCSPAATSPTPQPQPPAPAQPAPPESAADNGEFEGTYHNSRNSLDWAGVYQGIVPSAAGMGIKVQLIIYPDEFFQLTYEYLKDGDPIPEIGNFGWGKENADADESGTFTWDETGNVIRLDVANWPPYFRVGEGMLTQLDMSGNLITGDLADNYILTKVDTLSCCP